MRILANEKPEETFRVIDRRLFTEDGQLREEVVEQQRQEQAKAEKAAAEKAAAPGAAAPKQPSAPQQNLPGQAGAEALRPSRSFQMLVDFLARNAALFLGGYTDPSTGRAILDLDGAREVIDMVEALREKTHGNLAPEDDRFLTEVLGSLKLSYLEVSKAAAQAMRESPPGGNPTNVRRKP